MVCIDRWYPTHLMALSAGAWPLMAGPEGRGHDRNVQTNVQDSNVTRAFYNCMMNFMTEDEFDFQWFSMVEKFGLNNNKWEEIREEASLSIVNCVQNVENYTYTFKKFGNANRIWTTRFIPSVNHIHYSCKMFETAGLPCSHTFSVMKAIDMQHIPSSLILDRWTTRAKDFSDIKYSCEAMPTPIMEKAKYGSLSSKCNKMCYFASKSNDGFKEANEEIDKLTLRMQDLMPSSLIHSHNMLGVQHVHNVKDPSMVATKGSIRRKKNADVKQCKCSKCGQLGHTAKTCHANVQTNNSTVSSNAVHMYETNLTQNNDTSYGSPSTGPSYSFTFPVNDDCGGNTKHDLECTNMGFDPSSSTFDMHGYRWWGTTQR
ncbi:hypothetical protein LWI29_036755 [Acer saccharum]|uniref:CCHC-type domain-containing protein n=1 Tax=Acer saccharum TaxID=4024 RepID=A0AA39TK14_ACESA|nr:hypothetical protein LWI29_036755 [Acer saccharum]